MAWSNILDVNYPDGTSQKVPVLDDAIKTLAKALQERLNVCLYFPLTGSQVSDVNAGKIRKVQFKEAITKPTLAAGEGALYTKTVNSIAELFWQQADGAEKQLTTGGVLKVIDTDIVLTNDAWLVALNAVGDGNVNLIKAGRNEADDADVAVLPDLVRTATNAAPTENTQIPNKKYVDDLIAARSFGARTNKDSGGNSLAIDPNNNSVIYKVTSDGSLTAYDLAEGSPGFVLYSDGNNPPTTKIYNDRQTDQGVVMRDGMASILIKKNDYWMLRRVAGTRAATEIWWLPIGSGVCVKQ